MIEELKNPTMEQDLTAKNLAYYMILPYTYEYIREENGTWFVAVKELPGCMSVGDNLQDAYEMIRDAQSGWIETALELGRTIPEPQIQEEFSGKFNVRIPKSLHKDTVRAAQAEGVSLNQFVNVALAKAVATAAR